MGRFRKLLPYTAIGDGRRVARHRRRPAAVGLLLEGRDHHEAFLARRLRPLDHRARRRGLHRRLHDPADLPHVLRQRALARPAHTGRGSRRSGVRAIGARRRGRRRLVADSDPSPTVSYGDAGRSRRTASTRRTSRPGSWSCRSSCSPASPRSAGFINMPFNDLEFFDDWLEPSFRGRARGPPRRRSSRVRRSRCVSVILALIGIAIAYAPLPQGPGATPSVIRSTRSSGRSHPCSGNAYYYDDGRLPSRRRSLARLRRLPRPRGRPEDHRRRRSTASASSSRRAASGSATSRTASCAGTRSGSRSAPPPCCSTSSCGPGGDRGRLPDPVGDHRRARSSARSICLFMPSSRPGDRQGGRLRHHHDHLRVRRVAALELQHERPSTSSSSRTESLDPRDSAFATSSASTASASS